MRHSLQLEPSQVNEVYEHVKRRFKDKTPLIEAYRTSVDGTRIPVRDLKVATIDEHIALIISRGARSEHSRMLFDILSRLVQHGSLSSEELNRIIDPTINDSAENPWVGHLMIRETGTWVIELEVGSAILNISKCDPDIGEIVPEIIVELIRSTVLCLRSGSNLAALSLALVAFEAALWDHLSVKGIYRKPRDAMSVAVQRARKEGLINSETHWSKHLDDTFLKLRNNLVHQKSNYQDIEIPTPYESVRLGEFAERQDLALLFIKRIVEYVSDAYYEFQFENLDS